MASGPAAYWTNARNARNARSALMPVMPVEPLCGAFSERRHSGAMRAFSERRHFCGAFSERRHPGVKVPRGTRSAARRPKPTWGWPELAEAGLCVLE